MKPRITKQDWKDSIVFGIGYCKIQHLTYYLTPVGYTSGTYGHNSDIYHVSGDIYVSTGYRPVKTVSLTAEQHNEITEAEKLAKQISLTRDLDYDVKKTRVNNLFKNLFLDIYHENKNK